MINFINLESIFLVLKSKKATFFKADKKFLLLHRFIYHVKKRLFSNYRLLKSCFLLSMHFFE